MIEELNKSFVDYLYIDKGHSYIHVPTGNTLVSVTSFLKKRVPKFDESYWLPYKCLQRNGYTVNYGDDTYFIVNGNKFNPRFDSIYDYDIEFTPEELKEEWELAGKIGNTRGSIAHNMMENHWLRKVIDESSFPLLNRLTTVQAIKYLKSIEILKELTQSLYNEMKETYIMVATEYVVGDNELGIAGTFDLLVFNTLTGKYELWDYKTDKKLKSTGRELIRDFRVAHCELNKYGLQLGIYKYILEKNTSIEIDKCYIAHFDYRKNTVDKIEVPNFSEQINNFFNGNNRTTHI